MYSTRKRKGEENEEASSSKKKVESDSMSEEESQSSGECSPHESDNEDVSEEENKQYESKKWTTNPDSMRKIEYSGTAALKQQIPNSPIDAFRLLFTDEFLDTIVKETNTTARPQVDAWNDLTRDELLKFIGLVIHTGTIHTNRLTDYWKQHWLFNLTCFTKYMSRIRFMHLLKYLTFTSEPIGNKETELVRVSPLIKHFNETMKNLVYPGAELIVKETFALCQDVAVGQEVKKKKERGIRLHNVNEDNGITLKFNITTDSWKKDEVLFDLLENYLDAGHSVYLKEEYVSCDIANKLLERNTYVTGPMRMTSKMLTLTQTSSRFWNGVHIGKWKKFRYLTTEFSDELIEVFNSKGTMIMKPKVVIKYNNALAGKSRSETSLKIEYKEKNASESYMLFYPLKTNKLKWDKKVFVHILNQWLVNAHLLSSRSTYYEFRMSILENLLPGETYVGKTLKIPHTLTKIEKTKLRQRKEKGKVVMRPEVVRRDCRGCRKKSVRATTSFECKECEGSPGYCVKCFEAAHM